MVILAVTTITAWEADTHKPNNGLYNNMQFQLQPNPKIMQISRKILLNININK